MDNKPKLFIEEDVEMCELDEDQREDARVLYNDWQDAIQRENGAASEASTYEGELRDLGVDVDNPPSWIKG